MNAKDRNDENSAVRGKNLTDEQLKELELAGGVEGGMPAGSAGGPSQGDVEPQPSDTSKHRPGR
jgi:hypothetical protein